MDEKRVWTLKINRQFKNLIRPLQQQEYLQLEENILSDGCRDPIVTWNGFIIDGHNRYRICTKHQIPFAVEEMDFSCQEEAIAWICANQLGRRNITEETRKFLIGKQYDSIKAAARINNPTGINQYSLGRGADEPEKDAAASRYGAAERIARENSISHGTVEKYAIYSRAIDTIAEKDPNLVPNILSGRYKISHENVVELSKLPAEEVHKVGRRMQKRQEPFVKYNKTRETIRRAKSNIEPDGTPAPSVKDQPIYDPDAEVTGLALTIPSWASSIARVQETADFSKTSGPARLNLTSVLVALKDQIDAILSAIREVE